MIVSLSPAAGNPGIPMSDPDSALGETVLGFIREKKGHIADLEDVLRLISDDAGGRDAAESFLKSMAEEGSVSIAGDSVFLSSESYMPKVRCLICDQRIDRNDLVPFYREKHFPFVNWGFHRECLEGGALDEMIASGMFRMEDGKIFPAYEYGEGKGQNPVTIAIKYLRSDDFMYMLELKSDEG